MKGRDERRLEGPDGLHGATRISGRIMGHHLQPVDLLLAHFGLDMSQNL
jgi:hypothetical protein